MLALSLTLALLGTAQTTPDGGSPTSSPAQIDLYVFEDGLPLSGVEMRLSGESFGRTDQTGGLTARVPSGRKRLTLHHDGKALVDLDLLTDAGEIVQIITSLEAGREPELDIENSGRTSVLAEERLAEQSGQSQREPENERKPPGALVGTIVSAEDQEPVPNARIFFTGTSVEARTDEDGAYAVELPAGTYSVSVVHPDYATQTKDNIRVIPEREVTANMELTPAGIQLQDYVVTAPYVEGSIASTLEAQRETSSVVDVLGAEQMAATGDSDAAEALQRVSGLTIEDGKFVLVRGQPFRYTLTLWNGSPLPSPEPLVRAIPLDLFPTGVLSGIEVQKSYSADRLGSFGAGLVNLQTRGIPEEGFVSTTVSGGYNSESTFQEGRTYRGGSLDLFGYDDGTRALPESVQDFLDDGNTALPGNSEDRNRFGRQFSNNYRTFTETLPPDFGLGITAGNSIEIFGDGKLGAIGSLKWGTQWREQDRVQRSFAILPSGQQTTQNDLRENRTDFNADVGGLVSVQAMWEKHEVSSNTFYAHQTQQRTQFTTGRTEVSTEGNVRQFLLNWLERELIAQQLVGSNDFDFMKIDWRGMFSVAGRDAPDRRTYDYIDPDPRDGNFVVFGNSGMGRQYDTIDDRVISFGLDLTFPLLDPEDSFLGLETKVGTAGFFQDRNGQLLSYRWRPDDENGADISQQNPDILYDPANTGDTLIFNDFSDRRQDDSTGHIYVVAGYALADARLWDLFRIVGGIRYESADVEVITFTETPEDDDAVQAGFLQEEFFPSVSGTWFMNDTMQVRAAYGRTTSYPNLNELSTAPFNDPDTGELFVGSTELQPAIIDSVDVRWEWYPSTTESLTFGGFFKEYTDPIERTFDARSGTSPISTFQNADRATILGLEMSGRFEFANFREWLGGPRLLDKLYFMGNVALMQSEVTLSRQGIATNLQRPLDGQADYAVNAQAGYSGETHDVTFAFNAVGTRLHRAGRQPLPDIFLLPVPRLDVTWIWRMWETDSTIGILRLSGSNLLNPTIQWEQGGLGWREFEEGIDLSASFKLTFR